MNEQSGILEKNKDSVLIFLIFIAAFIFGGFLITPLLSLGSIIVVYLLAQIAHEYGHYLSHWLNKRNPIIYYNKLKIPVQVSAYDTKERPFTYTEMVRASFFGVIVGAIVIDIYFYLFHNLFYTAIINIFYIYASRFDIRDIKDYISKLYIQTKLNKKGEYEKV